MLQNDHSFLFPQIHFGSLEDLDEVFDLTDEEENEDGSIISFDTNLINPLPQKIGLYFNWLGEI